MVLTTTTPSLAATPPAPAALNAADALAPHAAAAPHASKAAAPRKVVTHAKPAVAPRKVTVTAPAPHRVFSSPAPRRTTTTHRTSTSSTSSTSQTAQPWGTDDYPYKNAVGNPTDQWGFTERQCVSFAAWRLAQHGHAINNSDNWGSAYNWDDTARRLGDTVTSVARVGEIAQWNANESSPYYGPGSATANGSFIAGGYGHVAYVKYVYADGSALVEQYNMNDSRSYSVMRVKAPRYLVIG